MVNKKVNILKRILLYEEYTKKIEMLEDRMSKLEIENAGMKVFIDIIKNSMEVKFGK